MVEAAQYRDRRHAYNIKCVFEKLLSETQYKIQKKAEIAILEDDSHLKERRN